MTLPSYEEVEGYPKQRMTTTGLSATSKLRCAWTDRYTLAAYFLGWPPPIYPYDTYWKARVSGVSIDPDGVMSAHPTMGTTMASYATAIITVDYNTPSAGTAQPHPDPSKEDDPTKAISETLEPFLEARKLNPDDFMWKGDHKGLREDVAPIQYLHRCKYTITRHGMLTVPAAMIDNIGSINNAIHVCLLIPSLYFPARTLLYESPRLSTSVRSDGTPTIEAALSFSYKEETWWKYFNANKTGGADWDALSYRHQSGDYEFPPEFDISTLLP